MPSDADPTKRRSTRATPATASPAGSSPRADLLELECGDAPAAWAALGFAVADDGEGAGIVRVGPVAVRCDGAGGGLRGWVLHGLGPSSLDGIPTGWVPGRMAAAEPGARGLDHVVVLTDSRDRTAATLVDAGAVERRRAEPPGVPAPMVFVRLGGTVVEIVEAGGPTRLWGLTAVVDSLSELPAELVGEPRAAVQPGREIVTVSRAAGLETAVAFMTPRARTR